MMMADTRRGVFIADPRFGLDDARQERFGFLNFRLPQIKIGETTDQMQIVGRSRDGMQPEPAQMVVQDMAVLQDVVGRILRCAFARRPDLEDRLDDVLKIERAGMSREVLRVPAQPAQQSAPYSVTFENGAPGALVAPIPLPPRTCPQSTLHRPDARGMIPCSGRTD